MHGVESNIILSKGKQRDRGRGLRVCVPKSSASFMLYSRKWSRVPLSGITGAFCGHTQLAGDDGGTEDRQARPHCLPNSWNLGKQAALTLTTKNYFALTEWPCLLKCKATYRAFLISNSQDTAGHCGFLLIPSLPALLRLGTRLLSLDTTHTFGDQAILC